MRKRAFAVILSVCCICASVFAQTPQPITQLPKQEVEPFKISRGVSFSASAPRRSEPKTEAANETPPDRISQDYREALQIIRENYVDGKRLDYNELTKSSLTAMLRALDPHSNFYDPQNYRELLEEQRSEYSGIGASIANFTKDGAVDTYVTSTFPDSPALRAGLRFGDKIVAVNGAPMTGKTSYFVREQIRGEKGKIVRVTVERAATLKNETLEIRRNTVASPSIPDAYLLRPGVGYVDLTQGFNYTTTEELETALKDLRRQGMTSLILDLRDNPGGILEQAVRVTEKFLGGGQTIVSQRGRFPIDNRVWKSANRSAETMPLVVLVNGQSASASEIVAGALQDYDRALIVGETTFGKGLVQSVINLPGGAGLTLTTARYFTPAGRSIQRDYSNGNMYDYFRHKAEYKTNQKHAGRTITGRAVYGGNGITPDETVAAPAMKENQTAILDSLFFFAREIAGGRIAGLENYKLTRPVQFAQRVRPSDFPPSDALFSAFKNYLKQNQPEKISASSMDGDQAFVWSKIRYFLATAAFGSVAANQVLIEEDPQVAKAVELLPKAQSMAQAAQKSWQNRSR
jgi:carboxyl-terminal processing protease